MSCDCEKCRKNDDDPMEWLMGPACWIFGLPVFILGCLGGNAIAGAIAGLVVGIVASVIVVIVYGILKGLFGGG